VQLSMNLFRLEETSPAAVVAELERRAVEVGSQHLVGLCPAFVASRGAGGRGGTSGYQCDGTRQHGQKPNRTPRTRIHSASPPLKRCRPPPIPRHFRSATGNRLI